MDRLQAIGTLCTTAIRSNALTSTSCGCGAERIPEEDHEIDATFHDGGTDLLVAAERTAQEPGDRQFELTRQQGSRHARSHRVGAHGAYPD